MSGIYARSPANPAAAVAQLTAAFDGPVGPKLHRAIVAVVWGCPEAVGILAASIEAVAAGRPLVTVEFPAE